ncbi:hypothetical protein L3Q82_026830 [Scortum barcoo]|uniref:Uncharacterized protein n=1 Tax=Scortum barcoo TaxID=214431 RepID=A0ACB8WKM1_9TELE|nr:hypothetical protein L3Q82_026830 [Scortum barcoo]
MLACGTPDAVDGYRQAKRAAAAGWSWRQKLGSGRSSVRSMEEDYRSASKRFWQTVRRLRRGKQYSTLFTVRVGRAVDRDWGWCFVDLEKALTVAVSLVVFCGGAPRVWGPGAFAKGLFGLCTTGAGACLFALPADLQHVLERFAAECEAAGMRISTSKSEAMVLDRKRVACPLQVGGEVLPQVEEFKYLGVLFTSEGKMEREIDRRIGAASAGYAVGVMPDRRGEEGAESRKGEALDDLPVNLPRSHPHLWS